ncbi:hypothetical protein BDN67DRAFT_980514 [Paxillus ammoniavirescens]|nr:hypothetical protein BDN67DRAFT_980514 [Paxillus ammoniavirescens]
MGKYRQQKLSIVKTNFVDLEKATARDSRTKFKYTYHRTPSSPSQPKRPTQPPKEKNQPGAKSAMDHADSWVTADQLESAQRKPKNRQRKARKPYTLKKTHFPRESEEEWESDSKDGFPTMSSIRVVLQEFFTPEKCHIDNHGNNLLMVPFCRANVLTIYLSECNVGLYPATQKSLRTTFTFQALDTFRLMNLECKVTAMSFNKYLRWITNPLLPNASPDRYMELLRVSWQWRYLQNKLNFGFFNDGKTKPKDGDFTYFCAACPQPGINLAENWADDLQGAWKYNRSFVMDGNFSAEQMQMKANADFHLTQGASYFTALPRYKAHLQIANDRQPWPPASALSLVQGTAASFLTLWWTSKRVNDKYSPDLIPGIGKVDGKVLETLWLQLNKICGSTQSMTSAHQQEVLDDHMLDSNRKKMLKIVEALSRKYIQAVKALVITEEGYNNLTVNAEEPLFIQWISQAEVAQSKHIANVTAMDIFDVQLKQGRGATSAGRRLRVTSLAKDAGTNPTVTKHLDLDRHCTRLDNMMDEFSRKAAQYIMDEVVIEDAGGEEDWQGEHTLSLPSNIGATQCQDTGLGYLLEQELELRQGQANEALHNIRVDLGHCSFLYRTSVQQVKHSQQWKSRAWDVVHQRSIIALGNQWSDLVPRQTCWRDIKL